MECKILAGPILRRTTKNRICVWLAASEKMELQLTIMDQELSRLAQSGLAELRTQRVQLGANLYIYLLQARPENKGGFPLDVIMYYSIEQVAAGNGTPIFSSEEIKKLTYGSHSYPSFFIPAKLKNLLHGSCRKPHGGFHSENQLPLSDALNLGHKLIDRAHDNLEERPAILLLTGDQIYADDVAISLFAMLREQALKLAGKHEMLPSPNGETDPSTIPLHGRKQALDNMKSGLSSNESENHLFTFAEFAAMYIYTFGNLPAWQPVWKWEQLQNLGIADNDDAEKAYNEQSKPLRSFHETLPNIRRLMANIPTYMIFDDHDVTDDWNITLSWYDDVRGSEFGRRIVSNALAAYWAFQGWGNDPDNFDKDMVWSIQQRLTDSTDNPAIAERYDLYTWKHRGWGFSVPAMPPIIAMDSRTQRQYDNKNLPAQLMDRYAFDWLRVEWAKLKTDSQISDGIWPVLIAATPVHGFSPIEKLQELVLRVSKLILQTIAKRYFILSWLPMTEGAIDRKLVNTMDIESWSANKDGYKALFDTLQDRMKLPGCVFISGDVHYAFTSMAKFVCNEKMLECWQLTSSALSNMPNDHNKKFLERIGRDSSPTAKRGVWLAWGRRKRWSATSTLLRPQESPKPIHAECNIGLVQFANGMPVSHTLLTRNGNLTYRIEQQSINT